MARSQSNQPVRSNFQNNDYNKIFFIRTLMESNICRKIQYILKIVNFNYNIIFRHGYLLFYALHRVKY